MELQFNYASDEIVAYSVYRPAGHITNDFFFVDFESSLIESQMSSGKKTYLGDFNIWMDQQNSVDANKFRSILNNFCMKNQVNKATHNLGHSLDLVIDCVENTVVRCVNVEPQNTKSDHMLVN